MKNKAWLLLLILVPLVAWALSSGNINTNFNPTVVSSVTDRTVTRVDITFSVQQSSGDDYDCVAYTTTVYRIPNGNGTPVQICGSSGNTGEIGLNPDQGFQLTTNCGWAGTTFTGTDTMRIDMYAEGDSNCAGYGTYTVDPGAGGQDYYSYTYTVAQSYRTAYFR